MPPKVTTDDGQTVRQSATQRWLWRNWLDYWDLTAQHKRKRGASVVGIINGDWGDINKHSKFQLVEAANNDIVIDMMIEVVQPMLQVCDNIIVIRGTEAHTGGVGWLENHAAKDIKAEKNGDKNSWYYFESEFDGVRIASGHHPGTNSMRPWTAGNEANRRAAMDVYNYHGEKWQPQITLWGHYHHFADSYHTHPIRAFYNACWQVKTAFVHRLGMSNKKDQFGAAWLFCENGKLELETKEYLLPRPKRWKKI